MKRVEIREACFEDLNEINRLVERVFDQFVAPGYSDEGVESFLRYIDLDLIRARFNQNHIIYIAENLDTKHIIGMLEIKNSNHVSLFFVDKAYMGQNIGRMLIAAAFEHCLVAGATVVTVNSSPNAVDIYKKLGFLMTEVEQVKDGIRYIPMEVRLKTVEEEWDDET